MIKYHLMNEDICQGQKLCNDQRHPTRNRRQGDDEADALCNNDGVRWYVVLENILWYLPLYMNVETKCSPMHCKEIDIELFSTNFTGLYLKAIDVIARSMLVFAMNG